MLSHIVIFWTDPVRPDAAGEQIAGAHQHLKTIPGSIHFHVGKMSPSARPVVEQSYQVGLNILFPDKQTEQEYQVHPQHAEFIAKYVKPLAKKIVVYDFES